MDDSTLRKLWLSYKNDGNAKVKEELIVHYAYIVRYLVSRVMIGMPDYVEEEELVSYAMLGLLDALDRYDPDRGIRFESFAGSRIKGAIWDGVRANDWLTRFTRGKIKEMERTFARLSQELSREPDDNEMSTALGLSAEDYQKLQLRASSAVVFSLDETFELDDGESNSLGSNLMDPKAQIDQQLMEEDERDVLARAIDKLPERERQIVSLYYYEGLNLKEIGRVLNVTESRVCQLHQKAILRLRATMSEE